MSTYLNISSVNNPKIKHFLDLQQKSKVRKKEGLFVIEGVREIELALANGYQLHSLFFDESVMAHPPFQVKSTYAVSNLVYQKMAYRATTEPLVAIAHQKSHQLQDLDLPSNPLILIMQSIEKPGNVGAMLRTADAAKVDAVILADQVSDLYNPNTIRSSVGGLFGHQIAMADSQAIIAFLKSHAINTYAATLQNSNNYTRQNYTHSTAFVVGTEATGLNEIWRTQATQNIYIPMLGSVDSMNVSVAAGILLFEAVRQRGDF